MKTKLEWLLTTLSGLAAASATQAALFTGWSIEVQNPILGPVGSGFPQQTTITVSANFSSDYFAFAAGQFDLLFSEGTHGSPPANNWNANDLLAPVNFDPTPRGTPVAGGYDTIRPGQLHFPAATIIANNADPIAVWHVTYQANDFSTTRTINLSTSTTRFDVYESATTATSRTVAAQEAVGSFLVVVPEPASAGLVLGLGGLGATFILRRRPRMA